MDGIERAIHFAIEAHGGQIRKGSSTPYYWHPLGVGRLLAEEGCGEQTVAAGILHDVLEDTAATVDHLREHFGETVARIVAGASEPDKSLPWEERKEGTLRALPGASEEVRLVFAADKLDNLRSIESDRERLGEEVWDRFHRGREKQAWYHREASRILGDGHPLLAALARQVDRVFGKE
ncbi:MAG: bifunctional (p)ppGpp synthetase/guanosine-3',5'-bis(diphosphate) 3'-pyrophosphohydrolase [Candidatus Eisenbacteria bacterium]|nr:bifunctional (p)ppGpp synthetase/guanosine-3',5'-bis(diphosphate) 3'-pyrophosphohydrolase [Candidatus Eisenbacteria bacterium]